MNQISYEDVTRENTSARVYARENGSQIGHAEYDPETGVFTFRNSWPMFVPWADNVSSQSLTTIDRLAWAVDAEVAFQLDEHVDLMGAHHGENA